MAWVKLDDRFRHHPKAIRVGPLGRDLYVCGLQFCAENLTDGFIPDDMVAHLSPGLRRPGEVAGLLLAVGFWERREGEDGYWVHDYAEWQPRAEAVVARRRANRERIEKWRDRNGVGNAVGNGVTGEHVADGVTPPPSRPVPSRPVRKDLAPNGALSGTARRGAPPGPFLPEAKDVLAWLNARAGKNFRPSAPNLDLIRARLHDGITVWQLKAIVTRKVREWHGDPERATYLRPETLFNRTKCEQYVGELPAPEAEQGVLLDG